MNQAFSSALFVQQGLLEHGISMSNPKLVLVYLIVFCFYSGFPLSVNKNGQWLLVSNFGLLTCMMSLILLQSHLDSHDQLESVCVCVLVQSFPGKQE